MVCFDCERKRELRQPPHHPLKRRLILTLCKRIRKALKDKNNKFNFPDDESEFVGEIQNWWLDQTIMQFADMFEQRHRETLHRMEEYLSKEESEQDKNEKDMQRNLVEAVVKQQTQLKGFHYLYDFEWLVDGNPGHGKGDLVFASATGIFAIVETKYINSSKSAWKQKKRDFVNEQADRYREKFVGKHPEATAVVAFVCINNDQEPDGLQVTPLEAYRVVTEAVPKIDSEKVNDCRERAKENCKVNTEYCDRCTQQRSTPQVVTENVAGTEEEAWQVVEEKMVLEYDVTRALKI
ncbi:hypothetical protein BC936DRAFT_149940 [Jimgerdemannia flammicorona]|uniref:Uncharacterized protein n=1 Tax=Jimgerdemannia flammicorona TaxID=994334 RepID=A0A433CZT7_9FUNG|nr:hypothetical protein BC936DRAFT_149940 [Jimgerdemannia flammicorona]